MKKVISIFILVCFLVTGQAGQYPVFAQVASIPFLPQPGQMLRLSPEFNPAYLKGIVVHPEDPFKFDFIIYKGDKPLSDAQKKQEYTKLTKYFLASLAIPDDDQWVNLSPYEKDRIIKDDFGKTEMGRDLLAQDYILKQITASLIYPEDKLGKEFWTKVYAQAQKQYGTTNIPINTFNKVWILPDDALIYEKGNTAYVLKNHLRVMLEEDYLSLQKHSGLTLNSPPLAGGVRGGENNTHSIASKIIKEIILPELQKEVNEDQNFAPLRQVYSGMLLATWFKKALKQSVLAQIYANKVKIKGVDQDPKTNEMIYQQYLKAYKKGVFNFIKEDADIYNGQQIPRKYFSGGTVGFPTNPVNFAQVVHEVKVLNTIQNAAMATEINDEDVVNETMIHTRSQTPNVSEAMTVLPSGMTPQEAWASFLGGAKTSFGDTMNRLMRDRWLNIFRRYKAGDKILDVASGNGVLPELALEAGHHFQFWAIDIARHENYSIPSGVKFIQMPLENLDGTTQGIPHDFDLVISDFGLEYTDWRRVIPNIAQRMKDKARAVFAIHRKSSIFYQTASTELEQLEFIDQQHFFEKAIRYFSRPLDGVSILHDPKAMEMVHSIAIISAELDRRKGLIALGRMKPESINELSTQVEASLKVIEIYSQFSRNDRISEIHSLIFDQLKEAYKQFRITKWLLEQRISVALDDQGMDEFILTAQKANLQLEKRSIIFSGNNTIGWLVEFNKKESKVMTAEGQEANKDENASRAMVNRVPTMRLIDEFIDNLPKRELEITRLHQYIVFLESKPVFKGFYVKTYRLLQYLYSKNPAFLQGNLGVLRSQMQPWSSEFGAQINFESGITLPDGFLALSTSPYFRSDNPIILKSQYRREFQPAVTALKKVLNISWAMTGVVNHENSYLDDVEKFVREQLSDLPVIVEQAQSFPGQLDLNVVIPHIQNGHGVSEQQLQDIDLKIVDLKSTIRQRFLNVEMEALPLETKNGFSSISLQIDRLDQAMNSTRRKILLGATAIVAGPAWVFLRDLYRYSTITPYAKITEKQVLEGSPEWNEIQGYIGQALEDPLIKSTPKYHDAVMAFQMATKNGLYNISRGAGGYASPIIKDRKYAYSIVGLNLELMRNLLKLAPENRIYKLLLFNFIMKEGRTVLDQQNRQDLYIKLTELNVIATLLAGAELKDYIARTVSGEAVGYRLYVDYLLDNNLSLALFKF